MSTKQRLHQLIDEMHEDQAAVLLMDLEGPREPLDDEDIAGIDRAREQLAQGKGVPHEEVMRRLRPSDECDLEPSSIGVG